MKNFGRYTLSLSVAASVLAGCGGLQPPTGRAGAMPQTRAMVAGLRPDRGKAWMQPSASKTLLYVDDDRSNDTYVYEYPTGKLVGTLTGFHDPRGMCVDQRGDVYISNYQYGLLIEYEHGGTQPINIYEDPGHDLIGCSISAKGDVAATAFDNVCIWKRGNSEKRPTCIESRSSNCTVLTTFGYDHDGDLVGLDAHNGGIIACMIPAGKTTMEKLSMSRIHFVFDPEGTSWDGKYIALGAYQLVNGVYESIVQPATLSGTKLTGVGSPIVLLDDCRRNGPGIVNPFLFGKQNVTAASTTRATRVTGPNGGCRKSGKGVVDVWKYPKAGDEPIFRIPAAGDMGADAVSIKE